MSEEERINILEDFIKTAQKEENFIYYSQYKYENEIADYVRDLLDAYKKEKEKNKKLEEDNEHLLITGARQVAQIDLEYISKDKIKEFIKEQLPDDEIMECCECYDSNGVLIRKELEKLLEE